MRFTSEFNDYLQSLSLEDRERELERVGYYRAGHGRPTTFDRPRRPSKPYDPNDAYSAAENMGSYMSEQAALGTQGLAGDGPSTADAPKTQAAIKRGMERFGISAGRVRELAKSAGVRVLDSDNDLNMIQALLKKEGGRTGPKSDIRINNRDPNQQRPDPRSDIRINNRDPNQVPRDRYINTRDPNQQRPDPRVKNGYGERDKGKGIGARGVSTVDVYGDRDRREQRRQRQERRNQAVARVRARREAKQNR